MKKQKELYQKMEENFNSVENQNIFVTQKKTRNFSLLKKLINVLNISK